MSQTSNMKRIFNTMECLQQKQTTNSRHNDRQNRSMPTKVRYNIIKPASPHPQKTGRPLSYRKSMELRDIYLSNYRMIKKIIEQPQSSYSADRMRKDWEKKKNLLQSLCYYPFQFDKRPKSNLSNRSPAHQKPKERIFNHNQVYTIKYLCNIDGHMLNITVELDCSCLRIIASNDYLDRDKYIELERGYAIDLINGYCEGSLYKVIERLRFDGKDLELVASEQQDAEILKKQLEETIEENYKFSILKGRLAALRAKRTLQRNSETQGIPALRYLKQIEYAELKINRL